VISAEADPAEKAATLTVGVAEATSALVATASGLSDQQAREPSLLPGWSRGHVLTHLARNADGLRNLLIWARTGVVTPQYPDGETRDRDIEAGSGRPAADLAADVVQSAAALAAEAARLTPDHWTAEVAGMHGHGHPAWYTLWRRLGEVQIHHVDLKAGYGPADWPEAFAAQRLEGVVDDFSGPRCPAARLRVTDSGRQYQIGPADVGPATTVAGPTRLLLAWLIGRSPGDGLVTEPSGPLPQPPPW
jgi:maleylpyruvate isomerase